MLEIPEKEGITSTSVDRQVPAVIAHIATILSNDRDGNPVRGDDDMVFLGHGLAGNPEFGALSLGGDDEAIIIVPEDGGVTLGADVGSISL